MQYKTVSVEHTFNVGNYESVKVRFEAELSEGERPLDVSADLEMLCHQHIQNMKLKAEGTATTPTVKPAPQVTANPTPAPLKEPVWEQMNATTLGPWERSRDLNNPAIQEIILQLEAHKGFYSDDLYKYWTMKDQRDETKINGVGRRQK